MEEFTDLINKLLDGFSHTHSDAQEVEVKQIDTYKDTDGCKYLSVYLKGGLPKKALDELRKMGYSIYHVSSELTIQNGADYNIGFYEPE